ncbi:MAG: efflux transporter outer membrane subunit [Delftia acidovorans]|jgi:NodT family efflux transporter outer membrane factor (OMF) lipoprotein|nr:efflux transporter outer membrane subunit [Delftia acidovorans]
MTNPSHHRTVFAALCAAALAGCATGPAYEKPALDMPATYSELPGWTLARPDPAGPKGDWWVDFHDPLLDRLGPQVAVSNQNVRAAAANYQKAAAAIQAARAALFPTLGVDASGSRQRSAASSPATSKSVEATVSWSPDLWGQVRDSVRESQALAQVSEATLANATLSAQVALATAVMELRVADENARLLQRAVDSYRESLRVVTDQSEAGTTPPSNLYAARAQLETTQASLVAVGVARAQYAHAIAVLVGQAPEALQIPPESLMPALPDVPVGLPSTLLQRRPDIAAAERQMAADNAAIGVAHAAFFPSVTLSAASGFASALSASGLVWSLGASLVGTLFDGGARSAQLDEARAQYQASVAGYRNTVLTALQDVENDLSALRILEQQQLALDAAVQDATQSARIALDEYQAGTVDYTTLATAQASQITSQQSRLNVRLQQLVNTVALIGDLGGGFDAARLGADKTPAGAGTNASAPTAGP